MRIVISQSFFEKEIEFFILIKEQNISNQSSVVIGSTVFLSISKLRYLVFYLKAYGCFDF